MTQRATTRPPEGASAPGAQPAKGARARAGLKAFHEEDALGKAYDARLVQRLWPFVRPHARWLALSLGVLGLLAIINLLQPIFMGQVAARAGARDADGLLRNGAILAGLLAVAQALTFVQTYTMQIAGARAMADLRRHVFSFLQRVELRYFDRTPVGRLVTRATGDVDALGEAFASGVLNAVGDLLALVGIVIMMLLLHWRLSLIAFAAMPIVAMVVSFVRPRSREAYRAIRTKTARLNAFLNEQVSGIAVVQAYAREARMAREFDAINSDFRDANKQSIYYEALLDASIELVGTLCIASILWYAALEHHGPEGVTFALVVTFTQYVKKFFEPISLLAQRYTILQSSMAGAERIFGLLDIKEVEPEGASPELVTAQGPSDEAIAFENVTFEYKPGVPVLKDVTFHVRRGERVALVGATGAGKTTVSSVALRLYEPREGVVRVLGRDVRSQDRSRLREQFSVVPQDVFLFAGSVASNVAMSDAEPDRARVEEALSRVGARDLFQRRGWLDAKVDERGANFSAGERQLLAFARALYRDAPLLVLDEATASIDSDTEARLQRALDAVMEGRTAIIIAHRLSTIRAVDRILVFHKGRIVEQGSHEQLLAIDGVYARLYRLQYAHERLEAVAPVSAEAPPVMASP